jgi:bifunctional non-homologous end joining protein LigD
MTRPQQLPLSIPPDAAQRLPERIRPMQPTAVDAPFDDPDYLFEPWWPGVRAVAFVEGGRLRLQVEGLSDALAAVPEVEELTGQLMEDGVVLDGTLLVLDAGGHPDPALLRARLAGGSRPGRPAFVAGDLLWSGGEELTRRPYAARRARLASVLRDGDRVVVGRGYRRDGTLVAEALAELGIDGLGARSLEARYRSGPAGDAWLRAPITPAEPARRPTLALIQRLPLAE